MHACVHSLHGTYMLGMHPTAWFIWHSTVGGHG